MHCKLTLKKFEDKFHLSMKYLTQDTYTSNEHMVYFNFGKKRSNNLAF